MLRSGTGDDLYVDRSSECKDWNGCNKNKLIN